MNTDHATTACRLDDYRSDTEMPRQATLLHDIRGRVNIIVTSAELLAAEKHGALNQKQSRYVSVILGGAAGIAEQLLHLDTALTRLNTREEPVRAE